MLRHVLLMLSSDQKPDPDEEVRWHVVECARDGETAVVTTRRLSGLTPGRSTVAFYGSAARGNRYLGRGVYFAEACIRNTSLFRRRGDMSFGVEVPSIATAGRPTARGRCSSSATSS